MYILIANINEGKTKNMIRRRLTLGLPSLRFLQHEKFKHLSTHTNTKKNEEIEANLEEIKNLFFPFTSTLQVFFSIKFFPKSVIDSNNLKVSHMHQIKYKLQIQKQREKKYFLSSKINLDLRCAHPYSRVSIKENKQKTNIHSGNTRVTLAHIRTQLHTDKDEDRRELSLHCCWAPPQF